MSCSHSVAHYDAISKEVVPSKQFILLLLESLAVHRPAANYGHAVVSSEIKFSPLCRDAARSVPVILYLEG